MSVKPELSQHAPATTPTPDTASDLANPVLPLVEGQRTESLLTQNAALGQKPLQRGESGESEPDCFGPRLTCLSHLSKSGLSQI